LRALITGGAGFIGSNLADALVERGDEVLIFDNLFTGKRSNIEQALERGAELVEADIRDAEAVDDAFERFKPELVFHLAAQMDVRVSVAQTVLDTEINVIGTINLLEAARKLPDGLERFVFASTGGAIYGEGENRELPFTEAAECEPEAPYGQAKLAAEGYCTLYERLHGLRATVLRLGNVYGPRQDLRGEAGVIAMFSYRLLDGIRPTVFGDGMQTRDYIYVGDVVAAMLAAGGGESGVFNIGTGVETNVLQLVEGLGRISGQQEFTAEMAPARTGEVQRTVLDSSRARDAMGWNAEVILLDDGLRTTFEWARETHAGG
jgi:UDP-glucose 4-epimerase